MSNEKNKTAAAPATTTAVATAPSTAVVRRPTVDEVQAALDVTESTATGKADHEERQYSGPSVPWIGYRSPKAKAKLEELTAAGVEVGQFYLYNMGVVAPKPFYIHLLAAFHFHSLTDDDNNILGVSDILTPELRAKKYSDHIIGVALVRLPGDTPIFTAATFSQRSGMTRTFDDIKTQVGAFQKDKEGREYQAKGPKHQAAFKAAKWPQFAVRARIWGKLMPPSTPGGREFNKGFGALEPTPVADVEALNRYMGLAPESYGGENKKDTAYDAALRSFLADRAEHIQAIDRQKKQG